MIRFLIKGILRDKNRSILPVIIISIGVMLTVLLSGYIRGAMGDMIDQTAKFQTGHVKVMTKAYNENKDQLPNDLALLEVAELTRKLQKQFPEVDWVSRINFGGLLDVPDGPEGSKGQGPAAGMSFDLLSGTSNETKRMNIASALVEGSMPAKPGEALIGHDFAEKLQVKIGDEITYMGSTMNGSLTFYSFTVSGTVRFGTAALDKGALIIDISDARLMLDMNDAAGEILGFLKSGVFDDETTLQMASRFNAEYEDSSDEYAPVMLPLRSQQNLGSYLDYVDNFSTLFVFIFVFAMSIVLWNTGLLGGLRRYREYGIRLALGEEKRHIYNSMIYEALIVGAIGSAIGTILGLGGVYYLQVVGINITGMLKNSTMMMPSVLRAKVTGDLFYIGFIPGLFAMTFGNMLSGIGIYKRQTATLFKELEV